MSLRSAFGAVARLELADLSRSRWLLFTGSIYAVLAGVFTLVGLRESMVLGFTGLGRVLLSFMHVLVLALPLLALTATGQVVAQARDQGALELLLTQPISRRAYLLAVGAVRYLALLVPLVALVVLMGAIGQLLLGQDVPWGFVGRTAALSASLLFAFVGLGMLVAAFVRAQAKALVSLLLVWVAAVALLDFALVGAMLKWRLNPQAVFLLAVVNPVQSVRMALLSGADPDLATLGPVGFYLATRLGTGALLAIGIGWPLAVGLSAFGLAVRRFARADLT